MTKCSINLRIFNWWKNPFRWLTSSLTVNQKSPKFKKMMYVNLRKTTFWKFKNSKIMNFSVYYPRSVHIFIFHNTQFKLFWLKVKQRKKLLTMGKSKIQSSEHFVRHQNWVFFKKKSKIWIRNSNPETEKLQRTKEVFSNAWSNPEKCWIFVILFKNCLNFSKTGNNANWATTRKWF